MRRRGHEHTILVALLASCAACGRRGQAGTQAGGRGRPRAGALPCCSLAFNASATSQPQPPPPAHSTATGEEALRESGVGWAVVRPGGLTLGERGRSAITADRDVKKEVGGGSISRADVAAVCVEALTNPKAAGAKFSVYCRKPEAPLEGDYNAHIASLFG